MAIARLDDYRPRLGGSTIAAAAGVDPYCSPIRLWLDLTQRRAREETEPMRLGKRLEPVIFEELVARGYTVERTPGLEVPDPARPWLIGHPDGVGLAALAGTIVEAKARGYQSDTLPAWHEAQVQTYMHLADYDQAIVGQLAGLSLTVYEVERSQRLVDVLLELGERFMEHVRTGVQPVAQGHPDDRLALGELWPDAAHGKRTRETRAVRDARRELHALIEREKTWKTRVEQLRAVVTEHMQDAEQLVSAEDETVATWRNVTSRRLDSRRLKAERPDVYTEFSQESTTRRLVLT